MIVVFPGYLCKFCHATCGGGGGGGGRGCDGGG